MWPIHATKQSVIMWFLSSVICISRLHRRLTPRCADWYLTLHNNREEIEFIQQGVIIEPQHVENGMGNFNDPVWWVIAVQSVECLQHEVCSMDSTTVKMKSNSCNRNWLNVWSEIHCVRCMCVWYYTYNVLTEARWMDSYSKDSCLSFSCKLELK